MTCKGPFLFCSTAWREIRLKQVNCNSASCINLESLPVRKACLLHSQVSPCLQGTSATNSYITLSEVSENVTTRFRMHSLCLVGNSPVKISDWWSRIHKTLNLAVFLEEKVCNQELYFFLWLVWESTVLRCKTGVQEKHVKEGIITIISTSVSQCCGIQTHKCLFM